MVEFLLSSKPGRECARQFAVADFDNLETERRNLVTFDIENQRVVCSWG